MIMIMMLLMMVMMTTDIMCGHDAVVHDDVDDVDPTTTVRVSGMWDLAPAHEVNQDPTKRHVS